MSNLGLQSKNGEATGKKVEVYNCEDRIANVHRQEEVGKGLVSKFAIPNSQFDIPSSIFHLRHSISAIPSSPFLAECAHHV